MDEQEYRERLAALEERTRDDILRCGHQVRFIFGTGEHPGPPFFYTVGRTFFEKPEFLVTGHLPPEVGVYICNEAARLYDEEPFGDGKEFPADTFLSGYPVRVIECDPEGASMFAAIDLGCEIAFQVVWPDLDGRFPGEDGCTLEQPLYPRRR